LKRRSIVPSLAVGMSIVIAVAVMVPRLMDPHFGLLDDGATIETARRIAAGDWITWDIQGGRFRPAYWAFWLVLYLIGGESPLAFFLGSTFLLAAVSVLVTTLLGLWTRRWWMGLLASVILVLSPPSVELYYTLSKGEGLQVFWILLALLLITLFSRRKGRNFTALSIVFAAVSILLACLSKETGVIILPLSVAGLLLALLSERRSFRWRLSNPYVQAVLSATTAFVVFFLVRILILQFTIVDSAGYASNYAIDLRVLAVSAYRWAGLLLSDFPYLLILLPALFLIWKNLSRSNKHVLLTALLWFAAWVGIFLPWDGITVYFQYPAAVGLAVVTAITLTEMPGAIMRASTGLRIVVAAAGIGLLLFLAGSIGNAWTDARVQLAVDRVNADALAVVARTTPEDGQVYVNIQDPNEYTYEIPIHLDVFYGRSDIRVETVRMDDFPPVDSQGAIVLAPYMHNAPVLTIRTGIVEPYIGQWDDALEEALPLSVETVAEVGVEADLFSFKLPQLLCGFVHAETYCRGEPRALDMLDFAVGWRVLRLP